MLSRVIHSIVEKMGGNRSRILAIPSEEVNFDHFHVLRAIGKGSFGKVCIVEKGERSGKMYAMKYVHKADCAARGALRNVAREVQIMSKLEHPFLVNLWFSFQDEEDLFMVTDLLLGGDLRYHIQHQVRFSEENIILFVAELALALDYLKKRHIVHRDIKPDNVLLDEEGHAHLTDFNVATILEGDQLATSISGTKPYIAPEIFMSSCDGYGAYGYDYSVDWWSLGVLAWETLNLVRPYPICSSTSYKEALHILQTHDPKILQPSKWTLSMSQLLENLLVFDPKERVTSLQQLQQLIHLDFNEVLHKKVKPAFTPSKNSLNCDPTFELEEMIIEARPLHKKKKRLAKQRSLRSQEVADSADSSNSPAVGDPTGLAFIPEYPVYNRERELEQRLKEQKETQWEEELKVAMAEADHKLRTINTDQETKWPQLRPTSRLNVSATSNRTLDLDFIDASPETSTS